MSLSELESMLSETSPSGEGLRNAATLLGAARKQVWIKTTAALLVEIGTILGSSREAIRGQNPHWTRNRIERELAHLVGSLLHLPEPRGHGHSGNGHHIADTRQGEFAFSER